MSSPGRRGGGLKPGNLRELGSFRFPCFAGVSLDASTRRDAAAAARRATGGAPRARYVPPGPPREPGARQARPNRVLGPPDRCTRRSLRSRGGLNPAIPAAAARRTTAIPRAPRLARLAELLCRGASAGLGSGDGSCKFCHDHVRILRFAGVLRISHAAAAPAWKAIMPSKRRIAGHRPPSPPPRSAAHAPAGLQGALVTTPAAGCARAEQLDHTSAQRALVRDALRNRGSDQSPPLLAAGC